MVNKSGAKPGNGTKSLPKKKCIRGLCTDQESQAFHLIYNHQTFLSQQFALLLEYRFSRVKGGPNSPSLDKIIPAIGYIKGNIAVMSHKANTMKQNATLEELILLGEWAERMIAERKAIRVAA